MLLSLTLIADVHLCQRSVLNILNINILYFHEKIPALQIHSHIPKTLFMHKKHLHKLYRKKIHKLKQLDYLAQLPAMRQFLYPVLTKNC